MSYKLLHDRAVSELATDLKQKGYSVIVEPEPSLIPFDLHNYYPDILATRNGENLIIDIKTKKNTRVIERYQEISKIIGKHKDWKFMLSTVDIEDVIRSMSSTFEASIENPDTIERKLEKLNSLLSGENYGMALPYLWSLYIWLVRLTGQSVDIPIDVTSDRSVLNYMYSFGEISIEEFDFARHFLHLRNEAVNNLNFDITREEIEYFYNHVRTKFSEFSVLNVRT